MDYRKLNNEFQNLMQKGMAWDALASKTNEAHTYCQKYLMVEGLGKNVWHSILEDAVRMRKELEANEAVKVPHKKE